MASPSPKTTSSTSKFKSSRHSSLSTTVTALGTNFNDVVKEGRLENGKLVVPADSESDDGGIGENGKRMVEYLRGGAEAPPSIPEPTPGSSRVTFGDVIERPSGVPPTVISNHSYQHPLADTPIPSKDRAWNSSLSQEVPQDNAKYQSHLLPVIAPTLASSSEASITPQILVSPSFPQYPSSTKRAQLNPKAAGDTEVNEKEHSGVQPPAGDNPSLKPKRVSRFMAQRM